MLSEKEVQKLEKIIFESGSKSQAIVTVRATWEKLSSRTLAGHKNWQNHRNVNWPDGPHHENYSVR